MTTSEICPVCEAGTLTPVTFDDFFTYKGQTIAVRDLQGMHCENCDANPIMTTQILFNQHKIADAKRLALGMFTSDQIRQIRETLKMSQKDCSLLLGGGANAFSKYERGEVIQSDAMDALLYIVHKFPFTLDALHHRPSLTELQTPTNDTWHRTEKTADEPYKNVIEFSAHQRAANKNTPDIWKMA